MQKHFLKSNVRHNGNVLNKGDECPEEHVEALSAQGLLEAREVAAEEPAKEDDSEGDGKASKGSKKKAI